MSAVKRNTLHYPIPMGAIKRKLYADVRVRCDQCSNTYVSYKNLAKHCDRVHDEVPQWVKEASANEACMHEENRQMKIAKTNGIAAGNAFIRRQQREDRQRLATFMAHAQGDQEELHQQYRNFVLPENEIYNVNREVVKLAYVLSE
jgi:DNA-directed RNA polymerase beta' subunit